MDLIPTPRSETLHQVVADDARPLAQFDSLRLTLHQLRFATDALLALNIKAGAQIARLADEHKRPHGGARRGDSHEIVPQTWREIVTQQTGRGYDYCRYAEKAARDLALELKGKRDEKARRVRALIEDPDGHEWSLDDFATVSQWVGATYNADTWTALLRAMGIMREPVSNPGGKSTPPKRLPLIQEARIMAGGLCKSFQTHISHREKFRKRLAALEVYGNGDPDEPTLSQLKELLGEMSAEVEETIRQKLN